MRSHWRCTVTRCGLVEIRVAFVLQHPAISLSKCSPRYGLVDAYSRDGNVTADEVFRGWPIEQHENRVWFLFGALWRAPWPWRDHLEWPNDHEGPKLRERLHEMNWKRQSCGMLRFHGGLSPYNYNYKYEINTVLICIDLHSIEYRVLIFWIWIIIPNWSKLIQLDCTQLHIFDTVLALCLFQVIWPERDYCACVEAYDYYTTMHALFETSLQIGQSDPVRSAEVMRLLFWAFSERPVRLAQSFAAQDERDSKNGRGQDWKTWETPWLSLIQGIQGPKVQVAPETAEVFCIREFFCTPRQRNTARSGWRRTSNVSSHLTPSTLHVFQACQMKACPFSRAVLCSFVLWFLCGLLPVSGHSEILSNFDPHFFKTRIWDSQLVEQPEHLIASIYSKYQCRIKWSCFGSESKAPWWKTSYACSAGCWLARLWVAWTLLRWWLPVEIICFWKSVVIESSYRGGG